MSDPTLGRHFCKNFGKCITQSQLTGNRSSLTQIGSACPFVQVNLRPTIRGSIRPKSCSKSLAARKSTKFSVPNNLSSTEKIALKSPQMTQGICEFILRDHSSSQNSCLKLLIVGLYTEVHRQLKFSKLEWNFTVILKDPTLSILPDIKVLFQPMMIPPAEPLAGTKAN